MNFSPNSVLEPIRELLSDVRDGVRMLAHLVRESRLTTTAPLYVRFDSAQSVSVSNTPAVYATSQNILSNSVNSATPDPTRNGFPAAGLGDFNTFLERM